MANQTEMKMIEMVDRFIINSFEKNNYTPKSLFKEMIGENQLDNFIHQELEGWLLSGDYVDYDCFARKNRDSTYDEDEDEDEDDEAMITKSIIL